MYKIQIERISNQEGFIRAKMVVVEADVGFDCHILPENESAWLSHWDRHWEDLEPAIERALEYARAEVARRRALAENHPHARVVEI